MRSLIIATIAALAFASAANAYSPPYRMVHGICHAPDGHQVPQSLCAPAPHCTAHVTKPCGSTCIPTAQKCHPPKPQ